MKHIENTSIYSAEKGMLIVRKVDQFIMGPDIDLGSADSIDNYEEKAFTKEEIKAFYESVGMGHLLPEEEEVNEEEDVQAA